MRVLSPTERRLRLLMIERYRHSSPTKLAEEITTITGKVIDRQLAYEVIRGHTRSMWIRKAIAKIFQIPVRELFPDYGQYRKVGRKRKRRSKSTSIIKVKAI